MSDLTLTLLPYIGGFALVALVMWFGVCAMDWFERMYFGEDK